MLAAHTLPHAPLTYKHKMCHRTCQQAITPTSACPLFLLPRSLQCPGEAVRWCDRPQVRRQEGLHQRTGHCRGGQGEEPQLAGTPLWPRQGECILPSAVSPSSRHAPSVSAQHLCSSAKSQVSVKVCQDCSHVFLCIPTHSSCLVSCLGMCILLGEFVTREHVCHNKSSIAHRGRTRINHLRELPTRLEPLCSGGQVALPSRTGEPQVYLRSAGCREVGEAASST
jgi:hypothetical protein